MSFYIKCKDVFDLKNIIDIKTYSKTPFILSDTEKTIDANSLLDLFSLDMRDNIKVECTIEEKEGELKDLFGLYNLLL